MSDTAVIRDQFGRRLRNLRVSVTDRCNLRCHYCMPEEEYAWLPRENILSFEEIGRLSTCSSTSGVDKVRLTGGEPLLRKDLPRLVAMLAARPGLSRPRHDDERGAPRRARAALKSAGLGRVTVSLDTLRPDRFRALTRRDTHARVLEGIAAVREAGWPGLKIDTVVIRGVNDDELVDLIEYGRRVDGEVRFIEYMDVGGATAWSMDQVVSRAEMLRVLGARYGTIEPSRARTAPRPRSASGCPTAPSSASSRRRRSPSAGPVTGAVSPPTGCGTSACTRRAVSTWARRCAVASIRRSSGS